MGNVSGVRRWLEGRLPRLLFENDIPGAQVAVLAGDEIVEVVGGVLNLRTGAEVTARSVFQIGSMTKVWTATLVMQLVDEGQVDLDVPVRRYLPEFRVAEEHASDTITTRHLLTHTAGFYGNLDIETTRGTDAIQRLVEDVVPHMPQLFPVGTRFSYTNAGYDVLGRLIEVLRGQPWAEVLRHRLLEPLGLADVATSVDEAILLSAAVGHVPGDNGQQPVTRWAMCESGAACGSLLSMPARGLVEFARLHLRNGVAPDGTQLLSTPAVVAMRRPYVDQPPLAAFPVRQGLGWMLPERPGVEMFEHGGDCAGQGGLLQVVPDKDVAVAVLSNGGDPGPMEREVFDHVLGELAGLAPAPERAASTPFQTVRSPERYVGRYRTPLDQVDVAADASGRLWWTATIREELPAWVPAHQVHEYRDVEPRRFELVPVEQDVFLRVDENGGLAGSVVFAGDTADGRAAFQYEWQGAVPRAD